jgi:predicted metallopeptidase
MDYSHISDFRDKQDLSSKIINHDLKYIESSDVVVVNGPSYGSAIEMFAPKVWVRRLYYSQKILY